jgi:hypothetical protein
VTPDLRHEVVQSLGERLVRLGVVGAAPTVDDNAAPFVSPDGDFPHQPGLADPGLAQDERRSRSAARGIVPTVQQ